MASHGLIVIGTGPGGYAGAIRAAQLGRMMLVFGKRMLGAAGICGM